MARKPKSPDAKAPLDRLDELPDAVADGVRELIRRLAEPGAASDQALVAAELEKLRQTALRVAREDMEKKK